MNSRSKGISKESFDRYGIEGIEKVFSDVTATKVVIVRDPLVKTGLPPFFNFGSMVLCCLGLMFLANSNSLYASIFILIVDYVVE